jgi:hypothetical protein
MTTQDYFEALVGQFLEVAGTTAKNQCVDSVNFYIKFVLRKPIIEWTDAKDFPSKVSPDDYDWISNGATNHPVEGDIVVWSSNHIAVCFGNDADGNKFRSFDENWPIYSPCRVVDHTYTNVSGWLRPKNVPVSLQGELDKCVTDRNAHWNFIINIAGKLGVETSQTIILAEIDKLITYEDKVHQQEQQLNEVQAKAQDFATQATDKALQLVILQKDVAELQKKLEIAIKDNSELSKALSDLKQQATVQPNKPLWQSIMDFLFKKVW